MVNPSDLETAKLITVVMTNLISSVNEFITSMCQKSAPCVTCKTEPKQMLLNTKKYYSIKGHSCIFTYGYVGFYLFFPFVNENILDNNFLLIY